MMLKMRMTLLKAMCLRVRGKIFRGKISNLLFLVFRFDEDSVGSSKGKGRNRDGAMKETKKVKGDGNVNIKAEVDRLKNRANALVEEINDIRKRLDYKEEDSAGGSSERSNSIELFMGYFYKV